MLWAYIHVPAGSTLDPTELVTRQVERFAPGFRDLILASHAMTAADREAFNPSYIGGDILGRAHASSRRWAARRVDDAVAHADARRVPRLGIHPARTRRARHAGLVRRAAGHATTPAPGASNSTDLFGA